MAELIKLAYSPWSEKARWALDFYRVPYQKTEHQPLFGEPMLRWKTKNFTRKSTVPILLDQHVVLSDSFEIALYAEKVGTPVYSLFPKDKMEAIRQWNQVSEEALRSGRALTVHRVCQSPAAKLEQLPPFVPESFQQNLRFLADVGLRLFRWKHRMGDLPLAKHELVLRQALKALRQALQEQGEYLLGEFTYADIAMAVVLHFVLPVSPRYIRLGNASRLCWTDPVLSKEFEDVIRWRDGLYERHRAVSGQSVSP